MYPAAHQLQLLEIHEDVPVLAEELSDGGRQPCDTCIHLCMEYDGLVRVQFLDCRAQEGVADQSLWCLQYTSMVVMQVVRRHDGVDDHMV